MTAGSCSLSTPGTGSSDGSGSLDPRIISVSELKYVNSIKLTFEISKYQILNVEESSIKKQWTTFIKPSAENEEEKKKREREQFI